MTASTATLAMPLIRPSCDGRAHATHGSLVEDEHDSAAASKAVLDVVAAVRTSRRLDG